MGDKTPTKNPLVIDLTESPSTSSPPKKRTNQRPTPEGASTKPKPPIDQRSIANVRRKLIKPEDQESQSDPPTVPAAHQQKDAHTCPICGKSFARVDSLKRHMKSHGAGQSTTPPSDCCLDCPFCAYQTCRDMEYFQHHITKHHPEQLKEKCPKCGVAGEDQILEPDHLRRCFTIEPCDITLPQIQDTGAVFPDDPLEMPDGIVEALGSYGENDNVLSLLNFYWSEFRQRHDSRSPAISHEFHFRIFGNEQGFSWRAALTHVYRTVGRAFNVSIAPTVLLRRARTEEEDENFMIFFGQDHRGSITQRNLVIFNAETLEKAINTLEALGPIEDSISRPGSAWTLMHVLSMGFFVHVRKPFICGGRGKSILPPWIALNTEQIMALERDRNGNCYEDRACLFRCIVAHFGGDPYDKKVVEACYTKYQVHFKTPIDMKLFDGVPETMLDKVEALYGLAIQVYRKPSKDVIIPLRISTSQTDPSKILNVHSHLVDTDAGIVHYSYIKSLDHFLFRHTCPDCAKMFSMAQHLKKHIRQGCTKGVTKKIYVGGTFAPRVTVFQELSEWGIVVEEERRLSKEILVLDCEAALKNIKEFRFVRKSGQADQEQVEMNLGNHGIRLEYHDGQQIKRLQPICQHELVTVAVASTLEEGCRFYHGPDPKVIVKELFQDLLELSEKARMREREKFKDEIQRLYELKEQAKAAVKEGGADGKGMFRERQALYKLERLCHRMDNYCSQLTIITFNGGRYDLQLIKALAFTELVKEVRKSRKNRDEEEPSTIAEELFDWECQADDGEEEEEDDEDEFGGRKEKNLQWPTAISRGTRILLLSTKNYRFIDMCSYVSPGTSLAKFLSAYHPDGAQKGHFPYELIDDYQALLDIKEFPKIGDFFSTLKGPISQKQYEEAKKIWDSLEGEKNMLNYIKWYNTQDVIPFLEASLRFLEIFHRITGVDIYKEVQSLPGVSLLFLFRRLAKLRPSIRFGLHDQDEAELSDALHKSITGGLAIIVHRLIEGGVTPIRNGASIAKKVVGYDANALYLWSIAQPMPTGKVTHWKLNSGGKTFVRKTRMPDADLKARRINKEVEYLRFRQFSDQVVIRMATDGPQQTLGLEQVRCDGFCAETRKVYFFNGCFWHNHGAQCLNKKNNFDKSNPNAMAIFKRQCDHLSEFDFSIDIMWECQWAIVEAVATLIMKGMRHKITADQLPFVSTAEKLAEYKKQLYIRPFAKAMYVTEAGMREAVLSGKVFGFARVSLRCRPEYREKYSEFPPIIKKAQITIDDVGSYMAQIAKSLGKLQKPQEALINSYFGESMWLHTEMITFLHKHGVDIEQITEIAQYDKEKQPPFDWFAEEVTHNRRQGDIDPERLGCIAAGWKDTGNSSYGKTVTNVESHMKIFYADKQKASEMANDPFHSRTVPIGDDEECYEIHCRPEKHTFALPIAIGLSVYAYAKIRMLEFIYDILIPYLNRDLWTIVESDTDSCYVLADRETGKQYPKSKGCQISDLNSEALTFDNYRKILSEDPTAISNVHNVSIRQMPNLGIASTIQEKFALTAFSCKRIYKSDGSSDPLCI